MSRRVLRVTGGLALAVALWAAPALAQGTSVLTGTVVDAATKKPVADAVVTATSPNLQGEQTVVTDAAGMYRIPQLPTGVYALRLEHEAYRPFSREGITLRLDTTVRVNVELLPETAGTEDIVVVGKAPSIDVGSTQSGMNIGSDFVKNIAVSRPGVKGGASRSFESLAELAPGAQSDAYGVSIAGAQSPEHQYIVDGVSVNSTGFGVNGTQVSVDFIQEVNVVSGGYLPEYGRATGGVVNAVTKSGSNEFRGSVFGTWTPGTLSASARPVVSQASTITGTSRIWNIGDVGAELGGPILKDKLWFYVGFAPNFQRNRIDRRVNALVRGADGKVLVNPDTQFQVTQEVPGTAESYFAEARSMQYIGKLTYNINQDHSLTLSVLGAPTASGGDGRFAISSTTGGNEITTINGTYEAFATRRQNDTNDVALKYSAAFLEKQALLDVTVGWHHQNDSVRPWDGSEPGSTEGTAGVPHVRWFSGGAAHNLTELDPSLSADARAMCTLGGNNCPVSDYRTGGPGSISDTFSDRYQAKAVGTAMASFLGHHVFKAGLDLQHDRFDRRKAWSGYNIFRELRTSTGQAYFQDFRRYGYLTAPDQAVTRERIDAVSLSNTVGGFLQDSWSIMDLVTLNAGVRYDAQTLIGSDNRVALSLANQVSPRLGLIYDFTGQGRSKVFASYARYFELVPLDLVDRQFPGETRINSNRFASACDPTDPADYAQDGACYQNANLIPASASSGDPSRLYTGRGTGAGDTVDPNLQPQSADEWLAGLEYEVLPGASLGATYTRRRMLNVIEDMSRDDGQTYFIGNPGLGLATDFPRAERKYDALNVYFSKAFTDLWLAQVSYTYANSRGNYPGLFRPETGQLDPNINSDFDLLSLLPNRTGPLPDDITHSFKAFVAKEFVLGANLSTNVGLSYRANSGAPINYWVGHPTYGVNEGFLLPRGAGGRLPWTQRVDGSLGVNYRLTATNLMTVSVDVFNLFNWQGITRVDQNFSAAALTPQTAEHCGGRPCTPADLKYDEGTGDVTLPSGAVVKKADLNPNFGNPNQYQAPRNVRFGVKMTF